ncbi:MAG: hypothetical protein JKY61_13035 [Planctomycetes bacterium]|nr:hypothetical protein [Planctomycetota bacterium]
MKCEDCGETGLDVEERVCWACQGLQSLRADLAKAKAEVVRVRGQRDGLLNGWAAERLIESEHVQSIRLRYIHQTSDVLDRAEAILQEIAKEQEASDEA